MRTVTEVADIAIGKRERDLTQRQKTLLRALFGDSAVLISLKQRLLNSEQYCTKISDLLSKLLQSIKVLVRNLTADQK